MSTVFERVVSIEGDKFYLDLGHSDTPIREEDLGFGPEPVYLVTNVVVHNDTDKQWYILVNQGTPPQGRYEAIVRTGQHVEVALPSAQRFEYPKDFGVEIVNNV